MRLLHSLTHSLPHSLLLALVLVLVLVPTLTTAGVTQQDFDTFTASLPQHSLTQQVSIQSSLFNILHSYREVRDEVFPYDRFQPSEHYGDYGEYHALEAEVNVGVVFVGFPDNSIPRIRDLFFNDLERRDPLHIGEQQARHVHVSASPGSAMINHQFHVVDTSFHADEVIRRYMRLLLRPQHHIEVGVNPSSSRASHYYINVWELEEALESLNWHMQHHLNDDNVQKKKRPSLTMFVMNLDLDLDLGVNIDIDMNINPDMDVDPTRFDGSSHKHSYSYRNGFSPSDLDRIRRNATCLQLAKRLLKEKSDNIEVSRKVYDHEKANHIASLHRDFDSVEDFEASVSPPPAPEKSVNEDVDEGWNQYYSDNIPDDRDEQKAEEFHFEEYFRLNEVHASKAWARGWSDDYMSIPDTMSLEARVLRILGCSKSISSFSKYKYDLARDIVLGRPSDMDSGGEEDNPGISWVGSSTVAWLDLGAKAQDPDASHTVLGDLLSLGETLNYRDMSRVNAEETGGRSDGAVYGAVGANPEQTEFPHKTELYALRHSLHQHYTHCGKILLHTRRREIDGGHDISEEHLAHEDILYRLSSLPDLQPTGEIAPTYKRGISSVHFDPKTFIDNFNVVRSLVKDGMEANHLSTFSSILYLQQALISTTLELSVRLELAEDEIIATRVNGGDDMSEYYFELMEFHNLVLAEAIEVSNMFVGKGHFSRKGFSTKAIHDALATVGSSVLELTRLLLSKPVSVMPHIPQLKLHLAIEEYIRQTIEMEVKVSKKGVVEVDSTEKNAHALLKELREDALASAVFRGMAQEHQETLLMQAHFAQTKSIGGFGHGYDSYGDDYYGHHSRYEHYDEDSSTSAKKNAEVLMTRAAMTPPLLVPKYIEIEVYVVKMQDSYFPLVESERKSDLVTNTIRLDPRSNFFDDNHGNDRSLGFDMGTFMTEVQRLKLANQQMSITVHTIDGADEPTLYLGLAGCRRYRTDYSTESFSWNSNVEFDFNVSHYYSADCVWRHLQHSDNVDHSAGKSSGIGQMDIDRDLPDTQHVAMFMLSVDSMSPHYLDSQEDDELHQSVTFGDSILLIQNKHVSIPCTHAISVKPATTASAGGATTGRSRVRKRISSSWKGRNPLQAALESSSRVILGMGPLSQHTSISKHSHSKTHLTPLRVSSFHYSDLELASAFRNRILRSVDFAVALDDVTSGDISSVGHDYIPDSYDYLNPYTNKAIQELKILNWENAAVLANIMVKKAWSKRRHFNAYVYQQKYLNNAHFNFDVLELPNSEGANYRDHYGSYMDDDYAMNRHYHNHDSVEEEKMDDDNLTSHSLLWICILLAFKTLFVAFLGGGVSYVFYFVLARMLKNIYSDKSMLL